MKILWIVNIMLPAVCDDLGLPRSPFGGWLIGLSNQLKKESNIELHIVTVDAKFSPFTKNIDGVFYHLVDNSLEQWQQLQNKVKPNVVHIHGTEFNYGLNYIETNGSENVVFSIQGLVSVCYRYYNQGLEFLEILKNITFRDLIKRDSLFQSKHKFKKRGLIEREYFKKSRYVIGRTDWDHAHSLAINPQINYFYGGEILRPKFYESEKWNYNNCIPYTIFLSQAGYPIKGLHQVLKTLPLLISKYPHIKLKIGGNNILMNTTMKDKLRKNGYASIINHIIKVNGLVEHVEFLGPLSEDQMIEQYLQSNVFVCPSSIENSPNSLAEAQMLGVPNISSFVGGTLNMVKHGKNGFLYRFEEIEMLAYYIDEIFQQKEKASYLDEEILERHHPLTIKNQFIEIYNTIMKNS